MRKFALVTICALLLASPAQAQVPVLGPQMLMPSPLGVVVMIGQWLFTPDKKRVYFIQVAGDGATPEQARNNGFRLAVEQAVGTLILSETQVRNQRVTRDEIITYASGFVDRFNIISTRPYGDGYRVTMEVWVGESAIAQRLMHESVSGNRIDGARLATQVETLQQENNSKVRVVNAVLRDFPYRAFDIEVDRSQLQINNRQVARISTPVTIGWNPQYLTSLLESVEPGAVTKCSWPNSVYCARSFSDYTISTRVGFSGASVAVGTADPVQAITAQMMARKPALRMSLLDVHGRELTHSCRHFIFSSQEQQNSAKPNYLFESVNNHILINPKYKLTGHITLDIGNNVELMRQADRVEVRVVAQSECNKL